LLLFSILNNINTIKYKQTIEINFLIIYIEREQNAKEKINILLVMIKPILYFLREESLLQLLVAG